MLISVTCPTCKAPFRLGDQLAGKKVRCPKCQGEIDVPAADEAVAASPTVEIEKPVKPTQVKTDSAVTSLNPKKPKKPKTDVAVTSANTTKSKQAKEPDKPAKKKTAAKENTVADASPFALPSKNKGKPGGGKKAKGGCSGLMVAIFLFLGFALFGCLGCTGAVGWWFIDAGQQLAEGKDGPGLFAFNDDKDKDQDKKKADKSTSDKDKKKKKDGAKDAVKKDDAKDKDAKKDDALKDGPPIDPRKDDAKKDDAKKDKTIDPRKDDPFKDKKDPPPPGVFAITLGPDGTYRGDGAIGPDDPISPFNQRTHKAYQIDMQAGMTYQIDLVSTVFDSYLFLLDAKNNKITEDDDGGGFPHARIIYQAKTSDTYRIHVSHFDNKIGKYTLSVRRTEGTVAEAKDKDKDKDKDRKIVFAPDGTRALTGALTAADPLNKEGMRHHAYAVYMQEGGKYKIVITPLKKGLAPRVFLRDDAGAVVADTAMSDTINYVAKRTGMYSLEASAEKGLGLYALHVHRSGAVFVDQPDTVVKTKPGVEGQEIVFDAGGGFTANDIIGVGDSITIEKMPHKRYAGNFEAGVTYEIEMKGNGFTPAVLVYDDAKNLRAETQRQRALPTAHVLFRPTQSGSFQIQACALAGRGQFMLKVRRCDNFVIGDDFRVGFNVISFQEKDQGQVAPGLIWAADGKSFYALRNGGILLRIDSATGAVMQELNFNKRCHNLAMSAEGLLISVASEPGTPEALWIVDAQDLKTVKKKIPVPEMLHVAAGPDASVAVATIRNQGLFVLDLKKGIVTGGFKGNDFSHVRTTRDGKTVFAVSNSQPIHRFRVAGGKLFLEDATAKPTEVAWGMHLSADEQLAWSEGGNQVNEVPVFPRNNLKQPAFTMKLEGKNMGIGAIDPMSGWVFGRALDDHLVIYAPGGARRAKMTIPLFDTIGRGGDMSVAPAGGELLIRGHLTIAHVKIHTKGEAFAKLDPKKDDPLVKVDPKNDPKKDPPRNVAENIEAKDVTHRVIAYKAAEAPLRSPVWAADGKAFYVLCKNGAVQRISADTGAVDKTFNVGRGLGDDARLGICAEGLVVSYPGQILLIDLELAGIKKKINPGDIANAAVGRDASAGVVAVRGASPSLRVVDLQGGATIGFIPFKLATFNMKLSADGKYLFLADNGRILRYRVDGANLVFEENSPTVVTAPGVLNMSADGKFVCLAGGVLAPPANHPERGLYVYAIEDLKKPIAVLPKIDPGRAVGVDTKGGWIYANEAKKPLVIFTTAGVRKGEFPLPEVEGTAFTEYIVSPLGQAFLIRTATSIIHVKIEVAGAPLAMAK